jgi:DNA-binding transcriptional regulator YhcF (GntR family)
MIHIQLDPTSDRPLFRQIADQILRAVREGKLPEGSRLPSERELSEELRLARGTVKKAYEELVREGIIQVRRGQGTFVGRSVQPVETGRKERALQQIGRLLDELERMRFSPREIETLVHISLLERMEKKATFHVAAVDCNTESLDMFHKQLAYMKGIDLQKFLLHEILGNSSSLSRLEPFKLIIVTSTHYNDLLRAFPSLEERIVQVAVSPSPETILELGSIGPGNTVGIVCKSHTFSQIIQNKLRDLRIAPKGIETLLLDEGQDVMDFIKGKDVIIIPPGYSFQVSKENKALFQRFREEGGKTIQFEYRIERGSLLHLEERIKEVWE